MRKSTFIVSSVVLWNGMSTGIVKADEDGLNPDLPVLVSDPPAGIGADASFNSGSYVNTASRLHIGVSGIHDNGFLQTSSLNVATGFLALDEWAVSLTITEQFEIFPVTEDQIEVVATVQNLFGPHGEGPGPIASFNFELGAWTDDPNNNSTISQYLSDSRTVVMAHFGEDHYDTVTIEIRAREFIVNGSESQNFSDWTVTIDGVHVPAPGSMAMLGLGGLVVGRRRRG